jgi:DNA-binding transcriptional MerR regulator
VLFPIDSNTDTDYNIPMQENIHAYTIDELAQETGIPVRTIRFYIAESLLPGPSGRGKVASYGEDHLVRLRLIRYLSERRVSVAEMRSLLADLSLDEVRSLLEEEERRALDLQQVNRQLSPKEYIATLLKRTYPPRDEGKQATPTQTIYERQPKSNVLREKQDSAEVWQRWILAPGIELHVRTDVKERSRDLITRLLKEAGISVDKLIR